MFSDIPKALEPVYRTMHQTCSIELFRGKLELHSVNQIFSGEGKILVEWRPFPRIRIKIDCLPPILCPELTQTIQLEICGLKHLMRVSKNQSIEIFIYY